MPRKIALLIFYLTLSLSFHFAPALLLLWYHGNDGKRVAHATSLALASVVVDEGTREDDISVEDYLPSTR